MLEIYVGMIISVIIHFFNTKFNWSAVSAIVAAIAVIISLIALYMQRKDIEKQTKYQRDTFELQHRIEEDTKLFDIASDIASIVSSLCLVKDMLYKQTLEKKYRWSKNVKGMGARVSGATIFADMVEIQYTESYSKLQDLENKNKLLEEQLRNQISKIKINIATLDSRIKSDIINKNLEFINELDNMESAIKKLKELDKVDEEVIKNNETWAKQYHEILAQKVVEFQNIFIKMKTDTYNKVEKIKNI